MLTPVAVASPRYLSPDAPTCQPCPWPVLMRSPLPHPYQHRFHVADFLNASKRCAELAQQHPTWPQSRVRGRVAREMNVTTTQLRYLLRQAEALTQEPDAPTPDTDALAA